VIVRPDEGIQPEEPARVLWTEAHIKTQNQIIDALRWELSSTEDQAEAKLRTFSNSITAVRGVYGSKYPAWPSGTLGNLKSSDDDESKWPDEFFKAPNVVRETGFHRGCHAQGLMNLAEVVIREVERDRMSVRRAIQSWVELGLGPISDPPEPR
jgi:hypothetical protein